MADDVYVFSNVSDEPAVNQPGGGDTTWGDLLTSLKVGTPNVAKSLVGARRYVRDQLGSRDPDAEKEDELDSRIYELESRVAAQDYSPRAQRVKQMSVLPKEGQESAIGSWKNFKDFVLVNGVESVPSLVASAVPAMALGPVFGATAATVGAGVLGGAMNAGDVYNEIVENLEKTPDAKLQWVSPEYRAYRMSMDEPDARIMFRQTVAGYKPLIAAAITIATSKYGVEGLVARRSAGEAVPTRLVNAALGLAGEGTQEFAENFSNKVLAGVANKQAGIGEVEWRDALQEALDGAVAGGFLGGGTGFVTGKGILPRSKQGVPASTPPATQPPKGTGTGAPVQPAEIEPPNPSAPTGSETQYPKGEAAKATGKKRQAKGTVPVVEGVDPAQEAAITAANPVPPEIAQKAAGINQPVTPEVTAPPAAPVVPPEIAQKTAELSQPPVQEAPVAPPPSPVVSPKIADKVARLNEPVAPTEDPTVAESLTQIKAQVQELVDGTRQAVLLPEGAPKVPMPEGMKSTTIGEKFPADTRGTYFYDPTKTSAQKLRAAAKNGTLGELLNMGPTTKAQSDGTVVQGVTPQGVATVQQATNQDAKAQDAAVIAGNMAPGSTVEETTAPAVLEARQQGEPKAPGAPVMQATVTPEVAAPARTPRVLEAIDNAEKQRAVRKAVRENIKALKKAEKAVEPVEASRAVGAAALQTKDKSRREAAAKNETLAKQVFDAHPPTDVEAGWMSDDDAERKAAREAVAARANRILRDAQERGFKMPAQIQRHSNEVAWLKEVENFAIAAGSKGLTRSESFKRFITREADYRASDERAGQQAREDRRTEGDVSSRRDQGDVETKAGVDQSDYGLTPEERLIRQEEDEQGPEAPEVDQRRIERRAPVKRVLDQKAARRVERLKKITPYLAKRRERVEARKAAEASKVRTVSSEEKARIEAEANRKTAKSVTIEDEMKRIADTLSAQGVTLPEAAIRKQAERNLAARVTPEVTDGPMRLNRRPANVSSDAVQAANGEWVVPSESHSLEKVLRALKFNGFGPLFPVIRDRILREVRGVQIHVVSREDMFLLNGVDNAMGLYDYAGKGGAEQIFVVDTLSYDRMVETVVHEAVHALVSRAMQIDPRAARDVQAVMDEVKTFYAKQNYDVSKLYGFTNTDEFIAEAWGNRKFQAALAEVPLSPQLAQKLGIEQWRTRSLWTALLEVFNKYLRLPNGAVSALEAIAKVTDEAAENREFFNPSTPFSAPRVDLNEATSEVTGRVADGYSSFGAWAKRNWQKFKTLDQLAQDWRGSVIGSALTKINEAVSAVGPKVRGFKERGDELAQRAIDLQKKNPEAAAKFAELAETVRMLDVSIEGTNDLGTDNSLHWRAKKELPRLQAEFTSLLPKEAKQLYRDMTAFYRDAHNNIVQSSVESILDALELKGKISQADVSAMVQRVMDKTLTDADKKLLGPTIAQNLAQQTAFHRVKGDYFPLMRFGDHVVRVEDKITDTMGGRLVSDDTVEFSGPTEAAARRAAQRFAENSELTPVGRADRKFYDKNTGQQVTPDQAKSLNDVEVRYQVKVKTKGVYFFDTGAQAARFVRENPEGHTTVHQPEMRSGSGYLAHNLTGTQMGSFESAIDNRSDLSAGQKLLLKSVVSQASIRMLSGNRISSRRLKAQKVTGASRDFGRSLVQYNSAMARHMATAEEMPRVRAGLREMDEALRNYEGNDRAVLMAIKDEVIARVDQGIHEPNEAGWFVKDMLTASSLFRLFSPMYSVINGMQPTMVTLPVLGGRFGTVRAARALTDAYSTIGFKDTLLAGFGNTLKAAKQFTNAGLLDTTDPIDSIRKKVSGDAGLSAMLDRLMELGAIDAASGIEVSSATADGRGRWGMVLAGTDRIARQLPLVVEAINRTVTAIASYKLARESGMSHEKATQFALDTTKNTQGDYSAASAPRFFNNPVLRPAMQFKKYAQMMTYLLADMAHRAFVDKNLSAEEKAVARKQLLHVVAVQIAMAGALSLPGIELVKAGFLISAALGFGGGWDDAEEYLRKAVDDTIGRPLGGMLMKGVIPRLGGIDISNRVSLSDMWLFGEPKTNDLQGHQSYLFQLMAGSTGSMVMGAIDGVQDLGNGDVAKGLSKMLPIKFVSDTAKAIDRYSKGNAGGFDVAANVFGAQTASQVESWRDFGVKQRKREDREKVRKQLSRDFYEAKTRGDRVKAAARNREFNRMLSSSEWRLRLPTNADWQPQQARQ